MSDLIEIPHISLMARVGLTQAERTRPQPISVGIRLELEIGRGLRDDLDQTFDYSVLDRVIPEALTPAPKLLETIAERIIVGLVRVGDCSRVKWIEVAVTKCQPPLTLVTDGVKVTLVTEVTDGEIAPAS